MVFGGILSFGALAFLIKYNTSWSLIPHIVRELWDVDFCFSIWRYGVLVCFVQANRVPVQDEVVRMNPNVSSLDS